jgi:hypothetical protein
MHLIRDLLLEDGCGPKAWKAICGTMAPSSLAAASLLWQQYGDLKFKEGQPFGPVFDQMAILANRLEAAEVGLSEPIKCMKIVASLPPSWLQNAEYLNTHRSKWSVTWLKEKIQEQEYFRAAAGVQQKSRTTIFHEEEDEGAAAAMQRRKGRTQQHVEVQAQAMGRNKSLPFVRYDAGGCWYCKKPGHAWSECRSKPANWKPGMKAGDGGAAARMEEEERGSWTFVVGQGVEQLQGVAASTQPPLHPLTHWALDSGASWSMTPDASLLTNMLPPPSLRFQEPRE